MEVTSLYHMMGGAQTIRRLVEVFYPRVQQDPEIGPLFPEDIAPIMEKQYLFLTQFFGGEPLYTQKHGHPMLRARHLRFPINEERARAWLRCMTAALDEIELQGEMREQVWVRLVRAAEHMINTDQL